MSDEFYIERGEMEAGSLAAVHDDKCNHLNGILWDMRARANIRKPFTPRPKPEYTASATEALRDCPKKCDIGTRRMYSHTIMRGIFQLKRSGVTPEQTADLIGMPLEHIQRILKHKTETSHREWMRVNQQPTVPSIPEIIRRLATESNHAYAANKKIV